MYLEDDGTLVLELDSERCEVLKEINFSRSDEHEDMKKKSVDKKKKIAHLQDEESLLNDRMLAAQLTIESYKESIS